MNILKLSQALGQDHKRKKIPSRGFKPWIEMLEDRITPADIYWTGLGVNNSFLNPANWQGGVVPAANDIAIIATNTRPCEITTNETLGGLQVGSVAQIGNDAVRHHAQWTQCCCYYCDDKGRPNRRRTARRPLLEPPGRGQGDS